MLEAIAVAWLLLFVGDFLSTFFLPRTRLMFFGSLHLKNAPLLEEGFPSLCYFDF